MEITDDFFIENLVELEFKGSSSIIIRALNRLFHDKLIFKGHVVEALSQEVDRLKDKIELLKEKDNLDQNLEQVFYLLSVLKKNQVKIYRNINNSRNMLLTSIEGRHKTIEEEKTEKKIEEQKELSKKIKETFG